MRNLIAVLVLIGVAAFLAGCGGDEKAGAKKQATYHCPMHPTYVDDKPSDCPICGMRLVPIKGGAAAEGSGAESAPAIPGRVTVMVEGNKRQTIGLSSVVVEEREFKRTVRTTGVVAHDETRMARIAPRFGGWVRSLQVNFTGQPVTKGQPLFTAYSPEMFTAENEYLLAFENQRRLSNSAPAEREAARSLLESAQRRLQLLEVGAEEIRALEKRGKPSDEMQFRAPVSGHVITKNAVEGKSFMAGETLYEIGHLEHLWVRANVPEHEIAQLRVGQPARVFVPGLQSRSIDSRVEFISPHMDPQTRRAEVRLDVQNPEGQLRPDMWANVEIDVDMGKGLAVPASAVIDTGTRLLAFVDREDEHLEPRELKAGVRTDDYIQVLEGVKAGERVVSRALFLVDSESQLKAAIAGMSSGAPPAGPETPAAPAAPEHKH